MSNSIHQAGNSDTRRLVNPSFLFGRNSIAGSIFALFAIELFLMGCVVWFYIINRHSYPGSFSSLADQIWGWIALLAAVWGSGYLIMSRQAARRWNVAGSRNLLAVAVASGAVLLGVLLLNITAVLVAGPLYMDLRPQLAMVEKETKTESATPAVGDAANGKKWFGMSCVTCHGPSGDGVANAAPSLRASDFLKTSDDATIASLIRNGRAADDPTNKTGKVMPAKGGNPFLEESKIADLVAFLQDMESQFAGQSTSGVSTEFTDIQAELAKEPPKVIRKWKLQDLSSINIPADEESVLIGMQAFVRATCNKCHMAAVSGRELGPTLDQMVEKYPREKLLQHIVEPSAEMNEKFQLEKFLLIDGKTPTGIIVTESEEKIELMTDLLKPDQLETILIDDIDDQVKSTTSPMPEGLLDVLTQKEIEGLLAYIEVVGNQMRASSAVQLNSWVVPAALSQPLPSSWATSASTTSRSFADAMQTRNLNRYDSTFSGLFVIATSVLAVHFLWVVGSGTAIVLHRELQLSTERQLRLAQQTILFWSIGMAWLVLWFLLFFLVR